MVLSPFSNTLLINENYKQDMLANWFCMYNQYYFFFRTKMNEEEEVQITKNPLHQRDSIKNENTDLTATPLKRYITIVGDGKNGSACKWICNFGCKVDPYTGIYSPV